MPSAVRRAPALALLLGLVAAVLPADAPARAVIAQPDPKKDAPKPAEPTAADVTAVADRFRAERADAVAAKYPPEALARADDLARRADAALAADNPRAAARYYRDARWQLPYLPVGLPPHVVRVFGESRMRHPERVNGVAYHPDGTRLASASADRTVKVWDLGNGRELVTYRGHAEQGDDPTAGTTDVLGVGGVAFHPAGKLAASARGAQVHLWDPDTGKLVKVLAKIDKADQPLKDVAFSPDGKHLAVGGDDGILRVFEVETGKAAYTSPPRNARIEKVAYSPNGKLVGVADGGGFAAVYAPAAPGGNAMPMSVNVIGGPGGCHGVAFTADSGAVFTCGSDGKARLTTGPNPDGTGAGNTATLQREYVGHTGNAPGQSGTVTDLAVTADGKTLVTGGDDRTVRVWEVTSGKLLRSFQGHMTRVLAVGVRPDGRQIASASEDGAIRLWDVSAADDHRAVTDAAEPVWAVAVSADGKRAAAAGADKTVRVYDPETGKLEAALPGAASAVTALAFFPDNNRLAAAGGDRVVRVWDVGAKKVAKELPGHTLPVLAVAVGADGKRVVSGSADRTARGWDAEAGKQVWVWSGKSAVTGVAVRAGGTQVAVGTADGTLVVLDAAGGETPKELAALPAHVAGVAAVAYSPDGSKLATAGGDGALRLWNITETGTPSPMHKFDGPAKPNTPSGFSPLSAVAFSADGRFVATAGADAVVRLWDVQTKAEVRGLRGHTEWATAVAFGPDARLLVSAGADKAVRIFELAPQEGAGANGHLSAVHAVAVSPDGRQVATAATDRTIKVWDLASGRELATLIGNDDIPFAVTFLGPDMVVMGGTLNQDRSTGRLHFWQTKPPRLVTSLQVGAVFNAVGAADGSRVLAWFTRPVAGDQDARSSHFEVFDRTGKSLAAFADRGSRVKAATFTPDLALAAAGDEQGVVRLFDLGKKDRVGDDWPVFARAVGDLGLTPDKKYLVAVDEPDRKDAKPDDPLIKVADVAKRETLGSVRAHKGGVRGLLVSPAGDTFATLGMDREIKVWSLATPAAPKEVRSWKLPIGVNGAAYTPDGKTLVTANADGTAYVLALP